MDTESTDTTTQAPPAGLLPGLEFYWSDQCNCDPPCVAVKLDPVAARPLLIAAIVFQSDNELMKLFTGIMGDPNEALVRGALLDSLMRIRTQLKADLRARQEEWRAVQPSKGGAL